MIEHLNEQERAVFLVGALIVKDFKENNSPYFDVVLPRDRLVVETIICADQAISLDVVVELVKEISESDNPDPST